jgi:hypothetical protein
MYFTNWSSVLNLDLFWKQVFSYNLETVKSFVLRVHHYELHSTSAASFFLQEAVLVPDMFCNFYLVKNHRIANNSANTEAREKISTYLETLENFLMYVWFNLKTF